MKIWCYIRVVTSGPVVTTGVTAGVVDSVINKRFLEYKISSGDYLFSYSCLSDRQNYQQCSASDIPMRVALIEKVHTPKNASLVTIIEVNNSFNFCLLSWGTWNHGITLIQICSCFGLQSNQSIKNRNGQLIVRSQFSWTYLLENSIVSHRLIQFHELFHHHPRLIL